MTEIIWDDEHKCRKARTCDQCLKLIQVGERYRKQVYDDGGLQTYRAHVECDAAASKYHRLADLRPDEGVILADDIMREDYGWLIDEYPAVAGRFNIQGPPRSPDKR